MTAGKSANASAGGAGGVAAPLDTDPRAPEAANPSKSGGGAGGVAAPKSEDPGTPEAANPPNQKEGRAELLARLRRIEGQVRGIQRMLEDDAYCVDVLNQISAVISASEKVGLKVLETHVRGCVADALSSGKPADGEEKINELTRVLETFLQVGHSAVAGPVA